MIIVIGMKSMHFWLGFDPLLIPIVDGDLVSIDMWSFVHTGTFLGLGFLVPDNMIQFFCFGLAWEVVEWTCQEVDTMGMNDFWRESGVNAIWDLIFNRLVHLHEFHPLIVLLSCFIPILNQSRISHGGDAPDEMDTG